MSTPIVDRFTTDLAELPADKIASIRSAWDAMNDVLPDADIDDFLTAALHTHGLTPWYLFPPDMPLPLEIVIQDEGAA